MPFYDHNVGLRRPPTDVVEGRVFGRADVPSCRFRAVELQDHEALGQPVALDCLNVAGTHEDSSAMRGDGRGGLLGELGVRLGVDDFSVHDNVALH